MLPQLAAAYLLTAALETAVLLPLLSRRHPVRDRLFAGAWLSACTLPVVWLVLPPLFDERWAYLLAAETFAPSAEVALFWLAFVRGRPSNPAATARDAAAVVAANLVSFGVGEALAAAGVWG